MLGKKLPAGGGEAGNGGFHVCRATCIQHAVAFGGNEGVALPLCAVACRHNIGMSGKTQHRGAAAQAGIEVFCVAERHFFHGKTKRAQPFGKNALAVLVVGGNGRFGKKLFGEGESGVFGHGVPFAGGI